MRLVLTARNRTVLDVEVRVLPRPVTPAAPDLGPTLRATGGGSFELADSYGDPATVTSFGFCARGRA